MLSYEKFRSRMLDTAYVFTPERYQGWKVVLITEEEEDAETDYLSYLSAEPNEAAHCVCLNEAYEVYKERECISDAYLYAIETLLYEKLIIDEVNISRNWDYCKTRVTLRLIGSVELKSMPKNICSRPFLNLQVIYQLLIKCHGNQIQPIVVTDYLLKAWGISEEELYRVALANTMYKADFCCAHMLDVLRRMAIRDQWQYSDFEKIYESAKMRPACFSLWDKNHISSDALLLDNLFLKKISEKTGGDLYLMVSLEGIDAADAKKMTKKEAFEYLESTLKLHELDGKRPISDSLYRYDSKTGKVSIVSKTDD